MYNYKDSETESNLGKDRNFCSKDMKLKPNELCRCAWPKWADLTYCNHPTKKDPKGKPGVINCGQCYSPFESADNNIICINDTCTNDSECGTKQYHFCLKEGYCPGTLKITDPGQINKEAIRCYN